MKTVVWMVVGLLESEKIGLTSWIPYTEGRATLYLALDTSLSWDKYCLLRLSNIYRGGAIPLVWKVSEHGSSSVAFAEYKPWLAQAATRLPQFSLTRLRRTMRQLAHPLLGPIDFEATFDANSPMSVQLFTAITHQRRIGKAAVGQKDDASAHRPWHSIRITDARFGPVHLAMAHLRENGERWYVLSDEPTSLQAVATLFLVCQGVEVQPTNKRRWVDPHWFRGNSYLRIGWTWYKHAKTKGCSLLTHWCLVPAPDPEPAIASRASFLALPSIRLAVAFQKFA